MMLFRDNKRTIMELGNKKRSNIMLLLLWFSLALGRFYTANMGGKQYNVYIVEVMLILIVLFFVVLHRNIKIPFGVIIIFQSLFIIWSLFTALLSDDQLRSAAYVLSLLYGLLTYIIAYNLYDKNLELFYSGIRIFSFIISAQIFYDVISIQMNHLALSFYEYKHVINTTIGSSNYLSIFLEFAYIIELINKKKYWIFYNITFLLALLLTLSKASILSLFVGLIIWSFISLLKMKIKNILWLVISFPMIYYYFYYTEYGRVFLKSIIEINTSSSIYSRLNLWNDAINRFVSSPFFGVGLQWLDDAHNFILKLLSDTGIIGFIIFFSLIAYILIKYCSIIIKTLLKQRYSYKNNEIGFFIAFLTVTVHSLFEPFFFGTTSQIWLGLVMAAFSIDFNNLQNRVVDKIN